MAKKRRRRSSPLQKTIVRSILWITTRTLGRLAPGARMRVARILGRAAATLAPARRAIGLENLKRAFPAWTDRERRDLLPSVYTHWIAFGLETLAMDRLDRSHLHEQVILSDSTRNAFEQLRRQDKGFIFVTAHMSNWEWLGAWAVEHGFDLGVIAKPQHEPAGDEFINSIRARMGLRVFDTRSSQLGTMRHLKKGKVLAILSDQDARRTGLFVPFFGELASTAPGAAWFARKVGIPVVPSFGYRRPDGRLRLEIWDPMWPDPDLSEEEDIRRMTQYHVSALEEAIRADPSQYLWLHRRWKTRPKRADLEALAEQAAAQAEATPAVVASE